MDALCAWGSWFPRSANARDPSTTLRAGSHPTDEDLSLHPSEQRSLAGDPESVGTPALGHPFTRRHPPAHRDNTAMNGAQLFKGQDESSELISGPPADVDQEVHATAGQETGATGPHPSRSSR